MSGAPGPSNLGAMNGSDVHSTLREMWAVSYTHLTLPTNSRV